MLTMKLRQDSVRDCGCGLHLSVRNHVTGPAGTRRVDPVLVMKALKILESVNKVEFFGDNEEEFQFLPLRL